MTKKRKGHFETKLIAARTKNEPTVESTSMKIKIEDRREIMYFHLLVLNA